MASRQTADTQPFSSHNRHSLLFHLYELSTFVQTVKAVSTTINDTPPWSVGVVSSFWNPLRVGIRSLGVVAVRAQRGSVVVVVVGIVVVVVAVVVVEVTVCVGWGGGSVIVLSLIHI